MNSAISRIFFTLLSLIAISNSNAQSSFTNILKIAAVNNGFLPLSELFVEVDTELAELGEEFFNSKNLSNSGLISCNDCHLDEFSSADGLPNSVGIGGQGVGAERLENGGEVIPRNSLPLWGRGHNGFDTLFWDGRVTLDANGELLSQFGDSNPSNDPLTVSVHLPVVEIREMLVDVGEIANNVNETVQGAEIVYSLIVDNLKTNEANLINRLAIELDKTVEDIRFIDVAFSISSFIRDKFQVKESDWYKFVYNEFGLSEEELEGARLFYGKGKCSVCHSGSYFTDFSYHTIPFPQIGFGRNGFGIDYGRYNVTHNPLDLYKFRTPPLLNVENTAPYGHSGSLATLEETIRFHFDPLADLDFIESMTPLDRVEYYKILTSANESMILIPYLNATEVDNLAAFLKTLSF
jgi:cytochrome c peroxidase